MKKYPSRVCKISVVSLILGASLYLPLSQAQQAQPSGLMPVPANVQTGNGSLRVDAAFTVALTGHTDARLNAATERFLQQLSRRTGLLIATKGPKSETSNSAGGKATLVFRTDHDSKANQELGEDESYTLEVTANGASITAPTDLGTLHALQTFLQLVSVSVEGFVAPAVTIQDKPRFPNQTLGPIVVGEADQHSRAVLQVGERSFRLRGKPVAFFFGLEQAGKPGNRDRVRHQHHFTG